MAPSRYLLYLRGILRQPYGRPARSIWEREVTPHPRRELNLEHLLDRTYSTRRRVAERSKLSCERHRSAPRFFGQPLERWTRVATARLVPPGSLSWRRRLR